MLCMLRNVFSQREKMLCCAAQGIKFVPMIAERSGGWAPRAIKVLGTIAKAAAATAGLDPGLQKRQYLEGLCVIIRRANARAILRRRAELDLESAPPGLCPLAVL